MTFVEKLRRLWRHELFKRLVGVRVVSQAADGTLQVGMASYVLFSPQNQPNAWAVAAVLAITLLPFSVIGPFVSLVLDRWSRRQIVVVVDGLRAGIAITIAALIATGVRTGVVEAALYGLLLVAMSLNRFVLAGLSAGLHYTVDDDEFLIASSVVPTIGPLGVVVGAMFGAVGRLGLGAWLPSYRADAVVFCLSAVLFVCSSMLASRIERTALGPEPGTAATSRKQVIAGLAEGFAHLRQRRPAALALGALGVARTLFGFVMVAVILGFRNYFHSSDINAAMADMSVWAGLTGVGFIAASPLLPPLTNRFGVRRTAIGLLVGLAVVQLIPGSIFTKWALLGASVLLGLCSQAFKICVDTLVQSHVDADFKGRVFVIYDMVFNAAMVVSAVIAAVVLPPTGLWFPAFVGVSVAYALLAAWFTSRSNNIGAALFEEGS